MIGQVESAIRIVRAIQIAMLLSVALFVLAGELVGSIPRLSNPTLFYALSLATITIVGVILVVRRTLVLQSAAILAERPNDAATLSRWRAGHVMTYALSEAIAMFGLLLRIIGFSLSQVASFYLAGFILLLFFSPRRPVAHTT
jgi:cytochrome b561